jgi:hypothetical protein
VQLLDESCALLEEGEAGETAPPNAEVNAANATRSAVAADKREAHLSRLGLDAKDDGDATVGQLCWVTHEGVSRL